jgi:hypothetical protein
VSVRHGARGRPVKRTSVHAVGEIFHVPDESIEVLARASIQTARRADASLRSQGFVDVKEMGAEFEGQAPESFSEGLFRHDHPWPPFLIAFRSARSRHCFPRCFACFFFSAVLGDLMTSAQSKGRDSELPALG